MWNGHDTHMSACKWQLQLQAVTSVASWCPCIPFHPEKSSNMQKFCIFDHKRMFIRNRWQRYTVLPSRSTCRKMSSIEDGDGRKPIESRTLNTSSTVMKPSWSTSNTLNTARSSVTHAQRHLTHRVKTPIGMKFIVAKRTHVPNFTWISATSHPCGAKMLIFDLWVNLITANPAGKDCWNSFTVWITVMLKSGMARVKKSVAELCQILRTVEILINSNHVYEHMCVTTGWPN